MTVLATAFLSLLLQAVPLQGVVVKKDTPEPLSRATVELRRDQENAPILDSTTTEDDGRFSFINVAPGRYRLMALRRGYTRLPMTITVASGQPAPDIRLTMTPTAAISGRVVDLNGRPVGNVEVKALKASYPEGQRVLTTVQSVQTNDLGEYRLFWLAPGRYYVAAVHPKAEALVRRIAGRGGVTVEKADPAVLVLDPRAELESSERYAPILFGGTTDEEKAAGVDLRAGADFGGVDIVVGPVRQRHVRGVVVDGLTGKPAQYGRIKDVKVDHELGAFDMLLFPGSYAVTATSEIGAGYATFTVGDADIDNLTISTMPTFSIRGRIVVEGEPMSRAALEALQITLRRDPPRGEPVTNDYESPLADGSFTISASAGNFRLNISSIPNAYVKSIRLGNADVLNAGLHLEGPTSAMLEVVIARNTGALNGQVVSGADATVLLIPDNRRRTELYRTTIADSAGRFHFDRVPPGSYRVFSWEEIEDGAWFDAEFMKSVESRGVPARVRESLTETVRIEVIRN